jgi:hypothetical protein
MKEALRVRLILREMPETLTLRLTILQSTGKILEPVFLANPLALNPVWAAAASREE